MIGSAFHFSLVRWYFDVQVYELVIFILEMLYFWWLHFAADELRQIALFCEMDEYFVAVYGVGGEFGLEYLVNVAGIIGEHMNTHF